MKRQHLLLLSSCLVAACSSAPQVAQGPSWPTWVLNPTIEGGLASADCVQWSNNISIDRQQGSANARVALAQQIQTQIKAMDKTYAEKLTSGGSTRTASSFESVSKQIVELSLSDSRISRVEEVTNTNGHYLCVQATLSPEATQKAFKQVVGAAGAQLNPQGEDALFTAFRAQQAQKELEQELKKK